MQVSIEPSGSIQNSNDIAYTWHGSTDLYQILGENHSRMCRKVSFNSEGLQFGTIANLICGQSGRWMRRCIASNKSRIDSMSYQLLIRELRPILVRMKYLAWRNDKLWHLLKRIYWSYKLWLVVPKSAKGS
jgi:hypothetical protein